MAEINPKKRKANPAFRDRKKRQKERVFTAIKMGVIKLCRDDDMYTLLQECVAKSSLIACEGSLLASFHLARLLDEGLALPVMDNTFFNQCVSSIANLGTTNRTSETKNPALMESVRQYQALQPDGYEPVKRLACMAQMLVMVAQQARENFTVSTGLTLTGRLARWFRLQIKLHSQQSGTTYFAANESKIIKSIVSVMTRASTQEPYSVPGLVQAYRRFQERQCPIPDAEMRWMQSKCDEVRRQIGPLPLNVQKQPHAYLPFLHKMLRDLETWNQLEGQEQQFKLFSLLPQKRMRPINIKINNTVLVAMNKYLKKDIQLQGRDLWDFYFHTAKVAGKEFEEFMVTDGLSASLIVSRPKKTVEEIKNKEQGRTKRLFEEADRVVAVDPGRNPILTAVVHNQNAMDSLQEHAPGNVKHEVQRWSKTQFYQEAGYTHRNRVTKLWMSKSAAVSAFNNEVKTARTSQLDTLKAHIRHVLANLVMVMDFYSAKRFKRLRWKTYISRQKAYEKIVAALRGKSKNPFIVWGDARFPAAGRGSPAVPTSELRRKLGSRLNVVDHDEFRTSKLSCCCHTPMQGLLNPCTGKRSWTLRVCENNACPRSVWDRNTSAAINILHLFLSQVRGEGRPPAFRRGGSDKLLFVANSKAVEGLVDPKSRVYI
jgi:hypothetical protein